MNCVVCGKRLSGCQQRYCSDKCRAKYNNLKARMLKLGLDHLPEPDPREITPTTVYLVHKYAAEGMPVKTIAELLDRCMDDVNKALAEPLTSDQERDIQDHFVKYKPRGQEG